MPEYPPAAKRLISQVMDHHPEAEVTGNGEVDGYGVTRAVTFDAKTSKWLDPILEAIDDDRIEQVTHKAKKATVTFVGDVRADYAHDFAIDEASQVLDQ
jgi:hypothetical protein